MVRRFVVLWLIASSLCFVGCRENYLAEKAFWRADRALKKLQSESTKMPSPEALEPVIKKFEIVADKYPSAPKAAESLFVVSNLRVFQKNFEEARKVMERILQNYAHMRGLASQASYNIGTLFESENKWEPAERAFWQTAEYYSLDEKGLYAPVHIIIHYKQLKNEEAAKIAYDRAMEYYQKAFKDAGLIKVAGVIKNYEALAQLTFGEWLKARETWISIYNLIPDSPYGPLGLLAAAELSWKRQDRGTALEIYKKFVELYPKHELMPNTLVQIGVLEEELKNYAVSREWYEKAIKIHEKNSSKVADLKLFIARSHQLEGNWTQAQIICNEIETKFKDTRAAFEVPLIKAAYYESNGVPEKSRELLDEAIKRYMELEQKSAPKSFGQLFAKQMLKSCYCFIICTKAHSLTK